MSSLPPPPPASGKPPESDFSLALGALLAGLTGALALAKNIQNRYYKNQTVHLDGYHFWNCGFHNCVLVTDAGTFSLRSCTLINCSIRYGPNLVRAIKMWNIYNLNTQWPYFNPGVEPDGSITIE